MNLDPSHVIAARRALYSRSLKHFVKAFWSTIDSEPFVDNWHVDAICAHLEAVADGRITRLLINVPPGTAKSMIASVMFPAWMWTRDPSFKIISTSHSLDNSTRDTRKSRDLIKSDLFQSYWPIKFREDQDQKTAFENVHRGSRSAKPFQNLTGSRANLVIVDDPHSVHSANSDLDRATTVENMLTAVPNRLNDLKRDAIVLIMQRLHEEDCSGVLLSKNLGYDHLCIPMEFEGDNKPTSIGWSDPRTAEGELLFPKKFPAIEIDRLKESLGPFGYAGQYQQRPAPKSDGFFVRDWFKRWGVGATSIKCPPRDHLNVYMTSDHAPGGAGDWNVFRIWGVDTNRNYWLLDSFRRKCTMNEALGVVMENGKIKLGLEGALPLARKWQPLCWFAENDATWTAIQGSVLDAMRATNTFLHIEKVPTKGSKTTKATSYRAKASQGMVYLPEGPIGDAALDEYVRFPVGKHDDQVDADGLLCRMADQTNPAFMVPTAFGDQPTDYGADLDRERDSDTSTFF